MAPISLGPQVLPGTYYSMHLPPSRPPSCRHLLWCAVLQGLQVDLCSPLGFRGLQGSRLPHTVFTKGCRGISALVPGASPVFSTDLSICRSVSHSPLLCSNFFPINRLSQSYCFWWSRQPVQQWFTSDLSGIGFTLHRESFWDLFKATIFNPPEPNALQTPYK